MGASRGVRHLLPGPTRTEVSRRADDRQNEEREDTSAWNLSVSVEFEDHVTVEAARRLNPTVTWTEPALISPESSGHVSINDSRPQESVVVRISNPTGIRILSDIVSLGSVIIQKHDQRPQDDTIKHSDIFAGPREVFR